MTMLSDRFNQCLIWNQVEICRCLKKISTKAWVAGNHQFYLLQMFKCALRVKPLWASTAHKDSQKSEWKMNLGKWSILLTNLCNQYFSLPCRILAALVVQCCYAQHAVWKMCLKKLIFLPHKCLPSFTVKSSPCRLHSICLPYNCLVSQWRKPALARDQCIDKLQGLDTQYDYIPAS